MLLFPTVGDPVRLPTRSEAAAAVPAAPEHQPTISVGRAPLAGNAVVRVDPDKLFGRHLAVLGNTGSGKSCTVAQVLRHAALCTHAKPAGFRAIVLDPNGEYRGAFDRIAGVSVRRFSVSPRGEPERQLRVPAWLWNYQEWLSFADASGKSQAPQLRRALHILRTTDVAAAPPEAVSLVGARVLVSQFQSESIEQLGTANALSRLDNVRAACDLLAAGRPQLEQAALSALKAGISAVLERRRDPGKGPWKFGVGPLDQSECLRLGPLLDEAISIVGIPDLATSGQTVDTPAPFDPDDLLHLLPILAAASGPEVVGWVTPMVERLRIALADERLRSVASWIENESLEGWLSDYFGTDRNNQITVIDLSLVPSNVLHLVVAALARLLLEALERRRRSQLSQLPVLLVVDEAHALIRSRVRQADDDQTVPAARLCREAFERIVREGRKFGLSLVVSSQRPSELSDTVLSQCNTFLIHRVVNDRDQALIRRLVPDSLGSLIEELPALQSQVGLLVGWAIDIPTLVRVDDLLEEHRPKVGRSPVWGGVEWNRSERCGLGFRRRGVDESWISC